MSPSKTHFLFTVGGVLSGLGKGITTASIGLLLKSKGFSVTAVKIDPYISIDAGTMRPAEHGETFITDDGGELDQDLGNYERFLGVTLTKDHNITTGKVFQTVIDNERHFVYDGRDAEMFPDIINEIKKRIYDKAKGFDFCLVEIGGTTGDLENLPFLHAAREIGRENQALYLMVTFLPFLHNIGELKTKPTQHAVVALRQVGINPDFIITRNEVPIGQNQIDTISARCFVDPIDIIDNPDTKNIADIPLRFAKEKLTERILEKFNLPAKPSKLLPWKKYLDNLQNAKKIIKIALIGKYVKHGDHDHKDVYVSVLEALKHAGSASKVKVQVDSFSSTDIIDRLSDLKKYHGVIVPQGWEVGDTKLIQTIQYVRERKILSRSLFGMQPATIEFARNVAGLKDASSEKLTPNQKSSHPPHGKSKRRPFSKTFRGNYPLGGISM
jgi:CTP synthase